MGVATHEQRFFIKISGCRGIHIACKVLFRPPRCLPVPSNTSVVSAIASGTGDATRKGSSKGTPFILARITRQISARSSFLDDHLHVQDSSNTVEMEVAKARGKGSLTRAFSVERDLHMPPRGKASSGMGAVVETGAAPPTPATATPSAKAAPPPPVRNHGRTPSAKVSVYYRSKDCALYLAAAFSLNLCF